MPREVTIRAEADEELLDRVEKIAESRGMTPQALVGEALRHLVEHDAWFRAQVQLGIESAESSDLIDHEDLAEELRRRYG